MKQLKKKILFREYCTNKCNIPSNSLENNNCYIFCQHILTDFFTKAIKDIKNDKIEIEYTYDKIVKTL